MREARADIMKLWQVLSRALDGLLVLLGFPIC